MDSLGDKSADRILFESDSVGLKKGLSATILFALCSKVKIVTPPTPPARHRTSCFLVLLIPNMFLPKLRLSQTASGLS
jgi:hypothetical protein